MATRKRKALTTAVAPARSTPLTDAERAELRAVAAEAVRRPPAPRFTSINGKTVPADAAGNSVAPADGVSEALFVARLGRAVGAVDEHVINHLMSQAARTTEAANLADQCNTATALLTGIQSRNETEGMLGVQMIGCHNLAMAMLRRATTTDRVDFLATYGHLAAKLLRTFSLQTEALARLRGQTGQQTVRVEHVTIEAGGQAVVGAVTTGGAGDAGKQR
jgi:hypothetical protein